MEVPAYTCSYSSGEDVSYSTATFVASFYHNLHALCVIEIEIVTSFDKKAKRVVVDDLLVHFDFLGMDILDEELGLDFDVFGFLYEVELFVVRRQDRLVVFQYVKEVRMTA